MNDPFGGLRYWFEHIPDHATRVEALIAMTDVVRTFATRAQKPAPPPARPNPAGLRVVATSADMRVGAR